MTETVRCPHVWVLPPSDKRGRRVERCRLCGASRPMGRPVRVWTGPSQRGARDPLAAGTVLRSLRGDGL